LNGIFPTGYGGRDKAKQKVPTIDHTGRRNLSRKTKKARGRRAVRLKKVHPGVNRITKIGASRMRKKPRGTNRPVNFKNQDVPTVPGGLNGREA